MAVPALLSATLMTTANAQTAPAPGGFPSFEARSIDGSGNNRFNTTWGKAGTNYTRVGRAAYADGKSAPQTGANERFISNRVFNDVDQTILSNRVTQWGWTWGQALDHTFGLRQTATTESDPIAFNANDPLEDFQNDLGSIGFTRSAAAPGTGTSTFNPRQQVNTVTSYIDASLVYGSDAAREEWLREGPVDGNMANNGPHLIMHNGYLPTAADRPGVPAPVMEIDGQLLNHPQDAVIAGDKRANENDALLAVQTLLVREHNRIVDLLPTTLSSETRFQIARRIVGAEEEYITYNEFLPAMGVNIAPYGGYKTNVNAELSNEFAASGYRAHSQVHAEFEVDTATANVTDAEAATFRAAGIQVIREGATTELVIPLSVATFNPQLLATVGIGDFVGSLGENQYANDEMIDNLLRSILFKVPGPNAPDPAACFTAPATAQGCFQGVVDLGAIDIKRGRDHGIPKYNDMRRAYGLPAKTSFRDITGEATEELPAGKTINSADIMDFVSVSDANGNPLVLGDPNARSGVRKTTLAARLKAIYGTVDNIDSFVGLVSEKHIAGTEFGELQRTIWKKQFEALRDGDRFYFENDPVLAQIKAVFGIDFKVTLAQLVSNNTGNGATGNLFVATG
ncbi:MAG TPA: peroxidase family protein [Acidimicrobiia bacterium]